MTTYAARHRSIQPIIIGLKDPKILKSLWGNLRDFRARRGPVSGLETETGWLDEYCRAHPSENLEVGTDQPER